jgi:2-polyprenyl-6-methoxyphenol hydroxylase-like FAD-dependent oxidoreductase
MQSTIAPRVLVSGASFAGLTSAFWMRRLGYDVTIVEIGSGLKQGGTPVDIREGTIDLVDRMGILEQIRSKALPPRATEFANVDGSIAARMEPSADASVDGYEIHRDDLLAILFNLIDGDVDVRFDSAIAELTDIPDGVHATFRDGTEGEFAFVLGCDGNHSGVRRLRFGPEAQFTRFLQSYFAVAIVHRTFIAPDTTRITNIPGLTVGVNSYTSTSDIMVGFHSDDEIAYDHRDMEEQKRIVRDRFADAGSPFAELVDIATNADTFYFDKLSQTSMPTWTSGRVTLVGDAGYCASPAAGMGGSLAIMGATALFDAFETAGGDIDAALAEYERGFRPVAEQIQHDAVHFGLHMFFPATEAAIQERNAFVTGR